MDTLYKLHVPFVHYHQYNGQFHFIPYSLCPLSPPYWTNPLYSMLILSINLIIMDISTPPQNRIVHYHLHNGHFHFIPKPFCPLSPPYWTIHPISPLVLSINLFIIDNSTSLQPRFVHYHPPIPRTNTHTPVPFIPATKYKKPHPEVPLELRLRISLPKSNINYLFPLI